MPCEEDFYDDWLTLRWWLSVLWQGDDVCLDGDKATQNILPFFNDLGKLAGRPRCLSIVNDNNIMLEKMKVFTIIQVK